MKRRPTTRRTIARVRRAQRPRVINRHARAVEKTDQRFEMYQKLEPGVLVRFKRLVYLVSDAFNEYGSWESCDIAPFCACHDRPMAIYVGTTHVTKRYVSACNQPSHKVCLFIVGGITAVGDPLDVELI